MTYPLKPHHEDNHDVAIDLMRKFSFAHFFSSLDDDHLVTRLPFVIDTDKNVLTRLRAHMNAKNPQANKIDGAKVLVSFSGPDHYISPNWRAKSDRGATWDYSTVNVWGRCKIRKERSFFETLINDLAVANESEVAHLVDKPQWSLENVTTDYVDRLFPALISFEVEVESIKSISKFHQDFPDEDALGVAEHLERIGSDTATAVAQEIRNRRK